MMLFSLLVAVAFIASNGVAKRPNIILIITDDQDLHLSSLDYMPITMKQMRDEGTTYQKHYCTIALCCPSRVNLLTGKAAHNTNVTDVSPPYGGYPKFVQQGHNKNYLPIWLQAGGYDTYYTGKLMNAHSVTYWNQPYPAGWNHTNYLVDPGTYVYNNACWQADTTPPTFRPGHYSTDVIADTAENWIEAASQKERPFFMGIAPVAPHTETEFFSPGVFMFAPPVPAKRHEGLFPNAKVPRGPSFNPNKTQGVSWVRKLPQANATVVESNDDFYRKRLQSLQSVDELVGGVINKLAEQGILNNTYIIYTTDNGFHIGQHRLPPGKSCAFEEDVNIPFILRGPGIPKNHTVNFTTSHTDIAPTILELAEIPLRDDFDGSPMPISLREMELAASSPVHDHVTIEYWGESAGEGFFQNTGVLGTVTKYHNNTYKAMRLVSREYDLLYTVWCTNEHELYDMKTDPYQTKNIYASPAKINGYSLSKLVPRLDALLMVLKSCKGEVCRTPWTTLHPDGKVRNLGQALASDYDAFYTTQPRISFTGCKLGYLISSEGPQKPLPFHIGD